jgi:hypothetical protein
VTKRNSTSLLDRESKIKLILAAQEKQRRTMLTRPVYTPNTGQLPVHLCKKKERFNFSANGGGKSTLLVQEIHAAAMGYNPWTREQTKVPCKIVVVVDNSSKITEVIMPEYKKWFDLPEDSLKRNGKPYISQILYPNGSVLSFYTTEADPGVFEGFMADYAFIDEPVSKQLITGIRRSLRIKGSPGRLLFCGTPIAQPWLRRDVYEPWAKGELPHVECFRTSIEVNEANLADGYIKQFASGLSDAEKETRLRGGFFDAEGMALSHLWRREAHIIQDKDFRYDERMPCVIAIDPHTVKAHHAVMLTVDKQDNLYVIKELSKRAVASKFAEELLTWSAGYKIIGWVCDSFGSAETTSFEGFTSFIDKLKSCGIPVRATTFQEKDAEDLVDRLRTLLLVPEKTDNFGLKTPKLRVLASCKGLISDIESAVWQKNRATGEYRPKLDTSAKDFLSCLGYALALGLFYDKPRRMRPQYITKSLYGVTGTGEQRMKMRIAARARRSRV